MITFRNWLAWCLVLLTVPSVSTLSAGSSHAKAGGALGIAEQPIGRTVTDGGHVAISLSVTGAAPIFYQWWKNNAPLTNNPRSNDSTNLVLNIDPVNTTDTGTYFAIASSGGNSVTSAPVSIVVSQLVIGITPVPGTGAWLNFYGQKGDVYRVEVSVDFGPFATKGYATNINGIATYFDQDTGGFRRIQVRLDHMLPVLYPPDRNDSIHAVRAYGKLNQVWRLQGALNLGSWDPPLAPQTNTTGWVKFQEFLPNNPARRFYRLVPP